MFPALSGNDDAGFVLFDRVGDYQQGVRKTEAVFVFTFFENNELDVNFASWNVRIVITAVTC